MSRVSKGKVLYLKTIYLKHYLECHTKEVINYSDDFGLMVSVYRQTGKCDTNWLMERLKSHQSSIRDFIKEWTERDIYWFRPNTVVIGND